LEGSTIPFLKVRRASLSPLLQSTFGLPPAYANMHVRVAKERKQCTRRTTKVVFLSITVAIVQY